MCNYLTDHAVLPAVWGRRQAGGFEVGARHSCRQSCHVSLAGPHHLAFLSAVPAATLMQPRPVQVQPITDFRRLGARANRIGELCQSGSRARRLLCDIMMTPVGRLERAGGACWRTASESAPFPSAAAAWKFMFVAAGNDCGRNALGCLMCLHVAAFVCSICRGRR